MICRQVRLARLVSLKALLVLCVLSSVILLLGFQSRRRSGANSDQQDTSSFHMARDEHFLAPDDVNAVGKEVQACVHPTMELNDPVMMKFYKKMPKIECKGDKNWVYVDNGTLRFSPEAKQAHPNMSCDYFALIRGPGDYNFSYSDPIKNISDGAPLVSEFFKIKCVSGQASYENLHAGVHLNETLKERVRTIKPPANGLGMSIVVLGFDSMSRMSWLRRLPKTREYTVNTLKAVELEGYNNMGDGTPAALFPILTGKHEQELPEARRNFKGAKTVDRFPWLWKDFSKNGYITSWADAQIYIAPFNYRLLGFEHSPADFFMRPYFLAADPTYKKYTADCQGSQPRHQIWLNWVRDIIYMYRDDPKFLFHFYTPLSHDDNNRITMLDDDLQQFVENLYTGNYLNNTLLILMADHGARFANVRATLSGKLEERLPYMSLIFPPWFEKKFPQLMKNVKTNINRLTTAMDLHETFKDFIKFDGAGLGDVKNRGISMFKEIPKSRTCAHADVAPHWCACLAWKSVSKSDKDAQRALQTSLAALNDFTQAYRTDCALLSIGNVTMLSKQITSDEVLKFKQTKGDRGLEPIMSDKTVQADKALYQLTFFTEPGHGEFEITVEHFLAKDKMVVNPKAISRINKYGNDPACILDKNREIRQYCYCKNNLVKP